MKWRHFASLRTSSQIRQMATDRNKHGSLQNDGTFPRGGMIMPHVVSPEVTGGEATYRNWPTPPCRRKDSGTPTQKSLVLKPFSSVFRPLSYTITISILYHFIPCSIAQSYKIKISHIYSVFYPLWFSLDILGTLLANMLGALPLWQVHMKQITRKTIMGTILSILWICLLIWSVGAALGMLPAPFFVQLIGNAIIYVKVMAFLSWIFGGLWRGICAIF